MLSNHRIPCKLTLLSAIYLAPITLLAWLYVGQSNKAIHSITKELNGIHYIAALRDVFIPLALRDKGNAIKGLAIVQQIHDEVGNEMHLDDTADRVLVTLNQIAATSVSVAGEAMRKANGAVLELIYRIGEGSQLVLDSELSSYYSMDLIVDKLPRATSQLMAALEAARRVRERNPPLPTDLVDLGTRLGELIGTMANIENTLQNAYRANPDGRLRMAYAAPFQRYREASENYVHGLREWLETTPTMTDMGELIRLHDTAVAEGSIAWKFASTELERLLQSRVDDFKKQIILNLGASVALLALAITLTVLIARSISQPVSKLVKAMNLIAEGELSAEIPGRARRDETGLLANSAAAMRRQLRTLSTEVRGRAAEVQVAAQKIAAAVEEQAATSNETSSSIAEITATMEELTASSTQIAEHSHAVVDIANQTWEGSKKGFEAMQLVMDKMGDIREDNQKSLTEILELGGMSKEISQVMRIITSVADQTKLIAFNAALESASAGDAGRRFGVVAAEIRRLADSVTDSTGEIEAKVNQIQDSINRLVVTSEKGANGITEGLAASITAGSLLNELVDAARQTANAAKQISLSTQQQKTASSQVVAALREIAIASGQTTQSISRIAEISTDMKCLFSELDTRITRFQMIEEESHG